MFRLAETKLAVSGNYKYGGISAVMQHGGHCFGGRRFSVFGGVFSAVGGNYKVWRYFFGRDCNAAVFVLAVGGFSFFGGNLNVNPKLGRYCGA